MRSGKTISVLMPCYNEEGGVATVIPVLPDFIDEIIVVDNNSTDNTAKVAERLGARVVFEGRQGYGAAYKKGFSEVKTDIVITMDGDGTYPAHAIPYLLDILEIDELDFISAARIPIQFGHSLNMIQRYVGNIILTAATFLLFGVRLRDSQSGMWVFRRSILDKVRVESDGMPFSEEFKIRAYKNREIKAREVPVQFKYKLRVGDSKLNLWDDGLKNLLYLAKLRRIL